MDTTRRIAAFSAFILLLAVPTLGGGVTPLKMDVSPSVSRAPAAVRVRVLVNAAPEDRTLRVVAESDTFYRSSEVQLDGADSDGVNTFEFRDLPSGLYQVTGVLVNAHGARATVSRLVKVEPGFGSR